MMDPMSSNEPWHGADAPDEDFEPDPADLHELQRDPYEVFLEAQAKWQAVGRELTAARLRLGISKREAARRADLSDGAWRHLESGVKKAYGSLVLPNPRPENLIAAAKAVGLNPIVLFELADQHVPEELKFLTVPRASGIDTPDGESISLDGLSDADLDLVVTLIARLKRDTEQP